MDAMTARLIYPFEAPPAEGEAVEVAPGILWMRLPLPMVLNHVNVYALEDTDGWTLIDTGFDSRRSRAIWARLMAGPLGGRPIRRVIATHHHPDHIGLAGWFGIMSGLFQHNGAVSNFAAGNGARAMTRKQAESRRTRGSAGHRE